MQWCRAKWILLAGLVLCVFMAGTVGAMDLKLCTVPDTLDAGGKALVLNGAGIRTKFFIKFYACALYLTKKDSDPDKIIAADEAMAVRLHFVRDVGKKTMTSSLEKGFEQSTKGNVAPIRKHIDHLYSAFPSLHKDDIVDLIYEPGKGVSCYFNGAYRGTSPGMEFKRALFGIWLCDDPVDVPLKPKMLGK